MQLLDHKTGTGHSENILTVPKVNPFIPHSQEILGLFHKTKQYFLNVNNIKL